MPYSQSVVHVIQWMNKRPVALLLQEHSAYFSLARKFFSQPSYMYSKGTFGGFPWKRIGPEPEH